MGNKYILEIEYSDGRTFVKKSENDEEMGMMLALAEYSVYESDAIRSAVSINGDIYAEYEQ